MKKPVIFTLMILIIFSATLTIARSSEIFKVDWLTISDEDALNQTWERSLIFLPNSMSGLNGRLIQDGRLKAAVEELDPNKKVPVMLFMHYCEGLGHHWEDMRRFAKLGFVVVGPDSFARKHRPLGCYEDRARFIRYFDAAVAMRKAELDYAVKQLEGLKWIDRKNFFLFGSGLGGLAVAHYEGDEFSGHLIEGWGCKGPNPIFDGIWAPDSVRVFTTVSKITPFLIKNEGFGVDCASYTADRADSVSVQLERPAQQVSWYRSSYKSMIRFLMRDMGVNIEEIVEDKPDVLLQSSDKIHLEEKWSDRAVYDASNKHCATFDKKSRLTAEPRDGVYKFSCD